MEKAAWTVSAGLHSIPSTCANQHELRDVSSLCSLAWESPPGCSDSLGWDQETVIPKSRSAPLRVPVEVSAQNPSGSLGIRERRGHGVGPKANRAWSTGWEAAMTVCKNQVHSNCWWTCGLLGSLLGHPCLGGQPHPTLGLLQTDAANMSAYDSRSPYPIRVPPLQLLRGPGKLYHRKEIEHIEQVVFLFISLIDSNKYYFL